MVRKRDEATDRQRQPVDDGAGEEGVILYLFQHVQHVLVCNRTGALYINFCDGEIGVPHLIFQFIR